MAKRIRHLTKGRSGEWKKTIDYMINPDALEAGPYPKNLASEKCQEENHPASPKDL
jgi:hypothetical protein